jgi:hypothetical protein
MSLDVNKLEKVRELANGVRQARCPACAEGGGDKKGEHLRIYPDGRYGCCVHPKDGQHRKRIFALVGALRTAAARRGFTVKVAAAAKPAEPARSVRDALACGPQLAVPVRTVRTGDSESVESDEGSGGDFRTLRTPISNPRAYAREECGDAPIYKDCEEGVLSVLEPLQAAIKADAGDAARPRLPFFTAGGTLSIPFDSPERYHWWKPGGQRLTVKEIIAEVQARQEEEKNGVSF